MAKPTTIAIIYRCRCGITRRYTYELSGWQYARHVGAGWATPNEDEWCPCGRVARRAVVRGRVGVKQCGGICTNAKGGSCDCKCGGANHGIAYA